MRPQLTGMVEGVMPDENVQHAVAAQLEAKPATKPEGVGPNVDKLDPTKRLKALYKKTNCGLTFKEFVRVCKQEGKLPWLM